MKAGLLERIKDKGHWRVVIKPEAYDESLLRVPEIDPLVRGAKVSLRGWSFPYTSNRNDELGGHEIHQNYVEYWSDWGSNSSFWRMYRSGQFLSYVNLREDRGDFEHADLEGDMLGIDETIYSISEFFEFASRLYLNTLLQPPLKIEVSLVGANGRTLSTGPYRSGFSTPKRSNAMQIDTSASLIVTDLISNKSIRIAECLQEVFDCFGWSTSVEKLQSSVETYLLRGAR